MKLGDTVTRGICSVYENDSGFKRINKTGKVVYIHPEGRYHTVEFTFPGGKVRESYIGVDNEKTEM